MNEKIQKYLHDWKEAGMIALFLNLLFDVLIVGWLAFFGFYTLEVLLPTFVTARFSLVKLFVILALLTGILLGSAESQRLSIKKTAPWLRFLLPLTLTWSLVIVTLSHYRFPWYSIPPMVLGYFCISFLFWRSFIRKDRASDETMNG